MNNQVCIRALADIDQINNCKSKIASKENSISQLSLVLGLAGNKVRLRILYLLYEEKELCVCDLSDILDMNVSAISQHLRKLKEGNIVDVRKEGQTYFYFIKNDFLLILESFFNIINSKSKILKSETV
ncbi:ArsR/SmtB family transcription factor [Ancylomarina longa]|uniref:ArsR family transcriptional regulator n=1 Tax=Ancylomarina longa TaxID=2487017 RepID=A0A434AFG5_9BACT|nr:metalloregulator ArsR/SmtB family transcription factor [Ancylomarina longa]RUT73114.1 ArsR family transcriptional regulator [Ancylomarina longa]